MIDLELACMAIMLFAASAMGTWWVRRHALAEGILDLPNARSMHKAPVPRGGGLAMVVLFIAFVVLLTIRQEIDLALAIAAGVGMAIVAAVGWLDDKHTLRNGPRLTVWAAASILGVACAGGMPVVDVGAFRVHLGWFGAPIAVVATMWMINLYNFMDGIDGLAGGFAVLVGIAVVLFVPGSALAALGLGIAALAAGFLLWNWPPARIFMGDVASGALGFLFAIMALVGQNRGIASLSIWALVLAPFLIDATFTVVVRMIRGEPWHKPHREHLYQRAARRWRSHLVVTCAYLVVSVSMLVAGLLLRNDPTRLGVFALAAYSILGALWAVLRHVFRDSVASSRIKA